MSGPEKAPVAGPVAATPAPATPEKVAVINPQGKVVRIAAGDLDAALEQGYHAASTADVAQQVSESKVTKGAYETYREKGLSPITAGAAAFIAPQGGYAAWREGAIEGATAGLGNLAEAKLGGALASLISPELDGEAAVKKAHKELKEAYPGTFAAGEVGGQLASVAIGGAAGRAAPIARALMPSAAFDAAGAAAGQLAARGLGGVAARGALGRAVATGLEYGARGAVENALYGSVHEASEEMLGDHELNSEKILAAGGEQGVLGGLLGFGMGAGGSLVKSGAQSAGRALKGLLDETVALHADEIEKLGNHQRWKSLDPKNSFTKEAEARIKGGTNAVGEVLGRYDAVGATVEETAVKAEAAVDSIGQRLGDITSTSPAKVKYGKVLDAFENALEPLRKSAWHKDVVASIDARKADLAAKLGVDAELDAFVRSRNMGQPIDVNAMAGKITPRESRILSDAWNHVRELELPVQDVLEQRKFLDRMIYEETSPFTKSPRVNELRKIRGGIEQSIVDAIDEAATKAGRPETKAELLGLKHDYQAMSLAAEAAKDSTASYKTNRNLSMSDYQSGGAAANVGAAIGGFVGGAPGAMMGGFGGGLAGALANKFARARGNAIAAEGLDKLAAYARAQQAIRKVDIKLDAAAKGIVEGATEAGTRAARVEPKPLRERYAAARKEMQELQSNPRRLIERLSIPSAHLPKTAEAAAMNAARTVAFLSSQTPQPATRPVLGRSLPERASDPEMARYVARFEGAKDRSRILDELARGRVRRDHVLVLQEVSPKMFADLQRRALDYVVQRQEAGKPLPFNARQRIHLLLGVVTDPSQDPKMMKALQANVAYTPESEQNQEQGPAPRPVDLKTQQSTLDRLEER